MTCLHTFQQLKQAHLPKPNQTGKSLYSLPKIFLISIPLTSSIVISKDLESMENQLLLPLLILRAILNLIEMLESKQDYSSEEGEIFGIV